jgi:hypothetical protein
MKQGKGERQQKVDLNKLRHFDGKVSDKLNLDDSDLANEIMQVEDASNDEYSDEDEME